MTDLYIIRHAWAEERDLLQWPTDWDRPLTREGRRRFAVMAGKLSARGFAPEAVATSPLVRCRQTAEIVAETVPGAPPVVELDALQPGSDLANLLAWMDAEAHSWGRVAWVGHAPDVGWLTGRLLAPSAGEIRFAKGAVAAIRFAGRPAFGRGELRWFVTAKVLGC